MGIWGKIKALKERHAGSAGNRVAVASDRHILYSFATSVLIHAAVVPPASLWMTCPVAPLRHETIEIKLVDLPSGISKRGKAARVRKPAMTQPPTPADKHAATDRVTPGSMRAEETTLRLATQQKPALIAAERPLFPRAEGKREKPPENPQAGRLASADPPPSNSEAQPDPEPPEPVEEQDDAQTAANETLNFPAKVSVLKGKKGPRARTIRQVSQRP